MTVMTSEQERDLFQRFGISVEQDWTAARKYQATMEIGWVRKTATANSKVKAVLKLKSEVVSDMIKANSNLTVEEAFEQYTMYKKLGV